MCYEMFFLSNSSLAENIATTESTAVSIALIAPLIIALVSGEKKSGFTNVNTENIAPTIPNTVVFHFGVTIIYFFSLSNIRNIKDLLRLPNQRLQIPVVVNIQYQ